MSLLNVNELTVDFRSGDRSATAVHGVDLVIEPGEIVGLVGESGSGKTVTSLALMGLLDPRTAVVRGSAVLDGQPLELGVRRRRGREQPPLAMVFQEPMTALDPVFTVGRQLTETLQVRQGMRRRVARSEAEQLLRAVGISAPDRRLDNYPHELSGGMRQRVMMAIALACAPKLLIADEPTTAVDVTIQAQLLQLISDLARDREMAVLLVTHDLGVVSETCSRMITMYAGRVVEQGPVREVLGAPAHPYTAGLLASLPTAATRGRRLATIPGRVPRPGEHPAGCVFAPRCSHAIEDCDDPQPLSRCGPGREVRCVRSGSIDLAGVR